MNEREHYSFVIDASPDGAYMLSVHMDEHAVPVRYTPKNDEERALLANARRDRSPLHALVRAGVFIVAVRVRPSEP